MTIVLWPTGYLNELKSTSHVDSEHHRIPNARMWPMTSIRDEILDILSNRATHGYGLSGVNQQQHALQAAALAERNGEPASFIVAALVHDIGHMVHDLGEDPAANDIDDKHEELGAVWLEARFGPDVTEPVRLHVPAKRYLCATDKLYFSYLAPDSVRSLVLQGGPMSADEVRAFETSPHAAAAVRLRRLDEAAKNPRAETPPVAHFMKYVDVVLADTAKVA
jgi:[1-hydroxy-2-(trimethylamino)ethyl]phosphonate dioxygenase